MKKSVTVAASIIMGIVVVCLMATHSIVSREFIHKQQELDLSLAANVYSLMLREFLEPMCVAETMANDTFLVNGLKKESLTNPKIDIDIFQEYLSAIANKFDYACVCVISDKTKRYYRQDGLLKVINPESDAGDLWYSNYDLHHDRYTATVYLDATDNSHSTIFFNTSILDEEGNFLGIVSTGLRLSKVLELMEFYENKYGVKINFTDNTGLVKLDSNFIDIDNASLTYLIKADADADIFHLVKNGPFAVAVTSYVEQFGWYFILRNKHSMTTFTLQTFYLVALLLYGIAVYVLFFTRRQFHRQKNVYIAKSTQIDSLTGLPNRNFFKDMFGERGVFNTTRYRSLAVFDIDFFKEANDNMNGDEALVSVVNNMIDLLNNHGMILRWGGDEFLVLFELPVENAYTLCRQFCKNIEAENLVTVSVGLTEVHLSDTIKTNYHRAAQYCYRVKEMGGNGVKKD